VASYWWYPVVVSTRVMSRVIEIAYSGDPQAIVDQAKAATGAAFTGDHVAGTFAGNGIEGHYRFGDTVVVVTIE
jgi:hypothetical protein